MKRMTAIMAVLVAALAAAGEPISSDWAIEEACYRVVITRERAAIDVKMSGRTVKGRIHPIALFGADTVIARVEDVDGGMLVQGSGSRTGIFFLPDGSRTFDVEVSLLAKTQEDSTSRFVALAIPTALQNRITVALPPEMRLTEDPGIADGKGAFHFPPGEHLAIRFNDREALSPKALVEIDMLSRIRVHGKRVVMATYLLPIRPILEPLVLHAPDGATFVESSLKASWIKGTKKNQYELRLPPEAKGLFSMEFALEERGDTFSLLLPRISGNNGMEGVFAVEEPDDGQLGVSGNGLVRQFPVARLAPDLLKRAGKQTTLMRIPADEKIALNVRRFEAVGSPPFVLAEQYFLSSFEENGNIMSVFMADLPPQAGQRARLTAVPDAEVWSLTVNRRKSKVYIDGDEWIIPLVEGETSHVELAFLRRGPKLGLQGRLEALIPATGLPSRVIRVGLALPERVDLLSIEGPVSPDRGRDWKMPEQMAGRPHFFSRAFYKGDGMKLVVSYKEPVKSR